jgi:hypothetical protein
MITVAVSEARRFEGRRTREGQPMTMHSDYEQVLAQLQALLRDLLGWGFGSLRITVSTLKEGKASVTIEGGRSYHSVVRGDDRSTEIGG